MFISFIIYLCRLNSELQLSFTSTLMGLSLVGVLWVWDSTAYTTLLTINGVALGFLGPGTVKRKIG